MIRRFFKIFLVLITWLYVLLIYSTVPIVLRIIELFYWLITGKTTNYIVDFMEYLLCVTDWLEKW